jgi:ankyrin repeat protein
VPALDALHRQARELERAHRTGDPAALERVAPFRPDPRKPLKDAGAQMVVAREHGFPSWVKLRSYVERVELGGEGLEHAFHTDMEYYEGRADGLLESARDATPSAAAIFEGEGAELTPEGARVAVAQRHGFASWSSLRRHVLGLAESGEPFHRAYVALEARDHAALAEVLSRFPELARARGTNGNALINMAHDAETLTLLLDAGADVAHANAHGWTPLHQAAYGDRADLAALLLQRGAPADLSGRGAGGTPLVVALFWGHHAVVEVLLEAGRHPDNLRVAAGTGDVDRIAELVPEPGAPSEAAGALRGFYRPHGGFPAWSPGDGSQEILDEALSWAARSDRAGAVEALASRGAHLDADVYRGTALTWAAAVGATSAIERLISLGADVNHQATFGGPAHGEGITALHIAAQSGRRAAVDALLAAGADPTIRDTLYNGPASGWAAQGGHTELAELLREREASTDR